MLIQYSSWHKREGGGWKETPPPPHGDAQAVSRKLQFFITGNSTTSSPGQCRCLALVRMRLSSAVWVVAATQFGRVVAQLSVVSGSFSVLNSVGISTASSESARPSPLSLSLCVADPLACSDSAQPPPPLSRPLPSPTATSSSSPSSSMTATHPSNHTRPWSPGSPPTPYQAPKPSRTG